jgi:hypothetical protein
MTRSRAWDRPPSVHVAVNRIVPLDVPAFSGLSRPVTVTSLASSRSARMGESAVEELCRIAVVPVDEMKFLDQPELGPTALEQQFEYWRASLDRAT